MIFESVGLIFTVFTDAPEMDAFKFVKLTKVSRVGSKSSRRVIALIETNPVTVIGTTTVAPGQAVDEPAVVTGAFRADRITGQKMLNKPASKNSILILCVMFHQDIKYQTLDGSATSKVVKI